MNLSLNKKACLGAVVAALTEIVDEVLTKSRTSLDHLVGAVSRLGAGDREDKGEAAA